MRKWQLPVIAIIAAGIPDALNAVDIEPGFINS